MHSDIGGSYLDEVEECVLISPMQTLDVWSNTHVQSTSLFEDAAKVKKQWVAKGWPADLLEIVTPPALALPADPQDRFGPKQKRVYAGLQLKRPVSGKLSTVYLRVMYHLAKEKGVPLTDTYGSKTALWKT